MNAAAAPPPGERTEPTYEYRPEGITDQEWADRVAQHAVGGGAVQRATHVGDAWTESRGPHWDLDMRNGFQFRLVHPEPPAPAEPRPSDGTYHPTEWPVTHSETVAAPAPLPPGERTEPTTTAGLPNDRAVDTVRRWRFQGREVEHLLIGQGEGSDDWGPCKCGGNLKASIEAGSVHRVARAPMSLGIDLSIEDPPAAAPVLLPPGDDEPRRTVDGNCHTDPCRSTLCPCWVDGTRPPDRFAAAPVLPPGVTRPDESRKDGFAGYHGCPSAPCTGTLASMCVAAGDCAALALHDRTGIPVPPPEPPAEPRTEEVGWAEAMLTGREVVGFGVIDHARCGGGPTTVRLRTDDGKRRHVAIDGTVEVLALGDTDGERP